MEPLFFCNIGWMSRYEGLEGKADELLGGGRYPREHGKGGEVCNFVSVDGGYVHGHVETIRGTKDRKINLEPLGGNNKTASISGITVVWTAPHPQKGGRRIVGWYRNATVFRERQSFENHPSSQHEADQLENFRIQALAKDAQCLDEKHRNLRLAHGPGWLGQTQWWIPKPNNGPEIARFVADVRALISGEPVEPRVERGEREQGGHHGAKSPSAATTAYWRYAQAYEVQVHPRHSDLQTSFENFATANGATDLESNQASVDLRFRDPERGLILAEVKPCDAGNARYAIRTAMGQLLDYRQRCAKPAALLIVIETMPHKEHLELANANGFGVAYPYKRDFRITWPQKR